MQAYTQQPKRAVKTAATQPRASRQSSLEAILQTYGRGPVTQAAAAEPIQCLNFTSGFKTLGSSLISSVIKGTQIGAGAIGSAGRFIGKYAGGLAGGMVGGAAGAVAGLGSSSGFIESMVSSGARGASLGASIGEKAVGVPATILGGALGTAAGLPVGIAGSIPAFLGADDNTIRDNIKRDYDIDINKNINGVILRKVGQVLQSIPNSHLDKLKRIQKGDNPDNEASLYDFVNEEINIVNPNGFPDFLYAALDKSILWERKMMDDGYFGGDDVPERDQKSVMAGISDANSQENLLSWTIRHEIGHAVDNSGGFMDAHMHKDEFGGWKTYGQDVDAAIMDYQIPGADAAEWVETKKEFLWAQNDGGPLRDGTRVFHYSPYNQWVSYLEAERRQHAVSNYQFSDPSEWFAEAYAAYYKPQSTDSANKLHPAVRTFFKANIGKNKTTDKK